MRVQYITDGNGETTGVYIPIHDWNELKSRFKDIEEDTALAPEWHRTIVQDRVERYNKGVDKAQNFDEALDDIEKDL